VPKLEKAKETFFLLCLAKSVGTKEKFMFAKDILRRKKTND
jgi:hypothetical protein